MNKSCRDIKIIKILGGKAMRINFKKIYGLILINTIIILSISSCVSLHTIPTEPMQTKNEMKIGIALYDAQDSFINTLYDSINYYAQKEEENGKVKIDIIMADGENNQEIQNSQIDEFINNKCNIIMVNIVDRAQAATIINKAKNANIPLIFFNREPVPQDMDIWDKVYYVGAIAEQSGQMQAEILIHEMEQGLQIDKNNDGIIQYVMIEGQPGHQDAILRSYYSIKVLEDRGYKTENLATDTGMWLRADAKIKMRNWLDQFGNEIEVIIANNDDMALGAIDALKEKGYIENNNTIPVIGLDGLEEAFQSIKEGTMLGTVLNNADKQGMAIFTKAYWLVTNSDAEMVETSVYDGKYLRTPYEIMLREMIK